MAESSVSGISRGEAYKFASESTDESKEILCEFWRAEGATTIDERGNTLLHFLVICGNEHVLKSLIRLGTNEELKKQNSRGNTALHEAARRGRASIAKILLEKERSLVSIRNKLGETALYLAAAFGKKAAFNLLLEYNSKFETQRDDGCTVLHAAIMGEYYRMAFTIVETRPRLAQLPNKNGATALNLMASTPSSFRSGSMYSFSNLGRTPFISLQILGVIIYLFIPALYVESKSKTDVENPRGKKAVTSITDIKRSSFSMKFWDFPWFKPIDDAKQKHILALALSKRLTEEEKDWSRYSHRELSMVPDDKPAENVEPAKRSEQYGKMLKLSAQKKDGLSDPLVKAIKLDIPELVKEILKKCPDAGNCFDENGRNVLHIAVRHKSRQVYELLKKYVANIDRMLADVDYEGNTILHLATYIEPATRFTVGVANLMAWDVYWFQRIRHECYPYLRRLPNAVGETAEELFSRTYSGQREAAEKALKDTNQGLLVVSALIGTISFAAIFTIPGGFQQTYGYPLLLKNHKMDVKRFLVYDGATLFMSLYALGTLLSVQLSRFHVDDFYVALPLKYLIAITALFYSSCFTVTACLEVFILEDCIRPSLYIPFLILSCPLMGLVYIDAVYYNFSYLFEVFRYSFTYKSQER